MRRVDEYFKHMEKVIHGTRFVPLEYENQFGRRNHGGKGFQCPKCMVGFTGLKNKKQICPICETEFN